MRDSIFSQRAAGRWHCCPGSGGSPSLEVLQNCGDVALRDVVSGHGGGGDLGGLFQPGSPCDVLSPTCPVLVWWSLCKEICSLFRVVCVRLGFVVWWN